MFRRRSSRAGRLRLRTALLCTPLLLAVVYYPAGPALAGQHPDAKNAKVPRLFDPEAVTAAQRETFVSMMVEGAGLSRTVTAGSSVFGGREPNPGAARAASDAFSRAARFVAYRFESLPIDRVTASAVNALVTDGTVPEEVRGDGAYRPIRNGNAFFDWLEGRGTPFGREAGNGVQLAREDPIALAEEVHAKVAWLEAFPDGNGRTARLMADLVLLKHGYAPALHGEMERYFERGSYRARTSRARRTQYFRAAAIRGYRRLRHESAFRAEPTRGFGGAPATGPRRGRRPGPARGLPRTSRARRPAPPVRAR